MSVTLIRPCRAGVNEELEAAADLLLRSEAGNGSMKVGGLGPGVLTQGMFRLRRKRELMVPGGIPDQSARLGMFRRAYNPRQTWLNGHIRGVMLPALDSGHRDDHKPRGWLR